MLAIHMNLKKYIRNILDYQLSYIYFEKKILDIIILSIIIHKLRIRNRNQCVDFEIKYIHLII